MPMWAVKEMLADWLGASWAYGGKRITNIDNWVWFNNSYPKIEKRLHVLTRLKVHVLLCSLRSREIYKK